MRAIDDSGKELAAVFSAEPTSDGAYIVVESRGGAEDGPQLPRNPEYEKGVELLLKRLGLEGATLVDAEVFSTEARKLEKSQRQISANGYPLPLELAHLSDADREQLRIRLGRAAMSVGQAPNTTGGNATKKLRFAVRWAGASGLDSYSIERRLARWPERPAVGEGLAYAPLGKFLATNKQDPRRLTLSEIEAILDRRLPQSAWSNNFWANTSHHPTRRQQWLSAGYEAHYERRTQTVRFDRLLVLDEEPTSDPDQLDERVQAATEKLEAAAELPPPPTGTAAPGKEPAQTSRFVRDPNIIAWVLRAANGHCEVCEQAAPFTREDGRPFLEVHHLLPLAEGGPDEAHNAVAACPNCHRRLHFGADRAVLKKSTIARITRLIDASMPPPST